MACSASFPPVFPWECVSEGITDFRSGKITLTTATKLIFAAGCLAAVAGGGNPVVGASSAEPNPFSDLPYNQSSGPETMPLMSVERCCTELEAIVASHANTPPGTMQALSPAKLMDIMKLILQFVALLGTPAAGN